MTVELHLGDCRDVLPRLGAGSVHCCVTSPPYYGLRDYGCDVQIGLEKTPADYVARLVEVFRAVRRVLRDDGTLWLNLGDSYNSKSAGNRLDLPSGFQQKSAAARAGALAQFRRPGAIPGTGGQQGASRNRDGVAAPGLKPKNLIGIPWRVAFALQADGWILRADLIWHKPNPMPESVRDRPTKAHEYLFLLAKSERYYYDADAVKQKSVDPESHKGRHKRHNNSIASHDPGYDGHRTAMGLLKLDGQKYPFRNRRSVWTVATQPFKGAHFAVMPEALVEPCVLAGCPQGGTVLDPFAGAGTVAAVASRLGRSFVGCELNPAYLDIARGRIDAARDATPLFA